MNLDEALAKDAEMRPKLLAAIAEQYKLDGKSIGNITACMLGNWLHGEAERKYQFLKGFQPSVDAHDAFHAELEKVVRQINLGEYDQAKAMLGSGTPCSKAFLAMAAAVKQLKTEAKL